MALVFGHDFRKVRGNSEATNQVKPALKLKDARVHDQEVLLPNPRDWQKTTSPGLFRSVACTIFWQSSPIQKSFDPPVPMCKR